MSARPKTKHHLDKRASTLLADNVGGDDDDLLDTPAVAGWLGVSEEWVENGRTYDYGPKFVKLSSRVVRYRRGDVRAWLKRRTHQATSEYTKPATGAARRKKGAV